MTPTLRARRIPRLPQHGFMLLEALVAMLILAFGVLGIVGLQASMTQAQTSAKFRANAAYLSSELTGAMWADSPNLASYGTKGCTSNVRCKAWLAKVSEVLPGGSASVVVNGAQVSITLTWTAPGEGSHSHTTSTAISL